MNAKLLTILLTACLYVVSGKRLRWVSNTNLDNPDNFYPKGPPCRNDHLTFPARSPSVYLQRNQTLVEIVLPNDGEIVMGEGSVLTFPESEDNSCAGRNIRFVGAAAKSWFDPGNWCVTESSGDNCLSSQPDLLDTDRIPCDSDDVVFPSDSGFYVDLETGIAIQMGSLKVAGQTMTTDSFRSYLNSDEGKLKFTSVNGTIGSVRVTIGGAQSCSGGDSSDCLCRTVTETFRNRVCELESQRCEHVACARPIQPVGRCCHICGALLVLSLRPAFRIHDLQNLIARIFRAQNVDQQTVRTVVSKMNESAIQVVLESTNNEVDAWNVGRKVKEELDRDPSYGAFEVHLLLSELDQPAHHTGDEPSSRAGLIAGLIIALIIVVIIILGAIYCYRNRDRLPSRPRLPSVSLPSPPDIRSIFRSDSSSRDKEDYEMRHQVAVFDNSRVFDVNVGFENPSFGDLYAVGEKQPIPDDYVAYDPPSKSSESFPTAATPTEPRVKRVEGDQGPGSRRPASEASDVKRVEGLGKRLQSPFRLVAAKLKGPKPVEEEAVVEEEGLDKEEESEPRTKTSGGDRKGQKGSMFVRSRDHERLEELEGDDVEKKTTRRVPEGRKDGFGNPLYAMEEPEAYDADLGEPGSASGGYETGQRGGRRPGTGKGDRTGFENPLFDDSKKPELESGVMSQKIIGAVEKDDESSA